MIRDDVRTIMFESLTEIIEGGLIVRCWRAEEPEFTVQVCDLVESQARNVMSAMTGMPVSMIAARLLRELKLNACQVSTKDVSGKLHGCVVYANWP